MAEVFDVKQMLYLECSSGISGDMAVAALLDLGAPEEKAAREEAVLSALRSIPMQGFEVRVSRVQKSGIDACDFDVILDSEYENHDHDMEYLHGMGEDLHTSSCSRRHISSCADSLPSHHLLKHEGEHEHEGESECGRKGEHEHEHERSDNHSHGHEHVDGHSREHRNLADVVALIEASSATPHAKCVARDIFAIIAQAEAQAHGKPVDEVHFHEVGAVDSVADVLAFAVAFDHLGVSDVVITDLAEGGGTVRCQHGVLPVPVPAVVNIACAHDLTLRVLDVQGELVTPTGAAIAAAVGTRQSLPERFTIHSVGIGAGKRVYETPGILRAMIIEPV